MQCGYPNPADNSHEDNEESQKSALSNWCGTEKENLRQDVSLALLQAASSSSPRLLMRFVLFSHLSALTAYATAMERRSSFETAHEL